MNIFKYLSMTRVERMVEKTERLSDMPWDTLEYYEGKHWHPDEHVVDARVERAMRRAEETPTQPRDTLEYYENGEERILSTLSKWDKYMSEKYYRNSESTPLELKTKLTVFDHIRDAWDNFCGRLMNRRLERLESRVPVRVRRDDGAS